MKTRINKNRLLLFLLLFAILIMGIGYSAINSITAEIKGKAIAEVQQGVFITNVEYVSNIGANLSESEIQYYKGTYMQSKIELSETNPNSEITYKVTVYNNSEESYPFLAVLYDKGFYDNENIVFEIGENGYKIGDIINPKEPKDIYITFKYKDGVIPENKILNSNLNFKIANRNRMILAECGEETTTYLNSTVTKNKIENIKFELGNIEPKDMVSKFDASEKQDESIIGYYTDTDKNGLYELIFRSNDIIFPNINAQFLFQHLSSLKEIDFENFSTYGETSMQCMFERCTELTTLDVSKFDTSNVTNMYFMFNGCSKLEALDVSKFDTSNVIYMAYMFCNCNKLKSLDVSNFNTSNVTTMTCMFDNCNELASIDVSKFDTSNVTYMNNMFNGCSILKSIDVSKFNTNKVTNMSFMFASCRGLTNLDISSFNTSNVVDMMAMFNNCSGLTNLYISNFDTSNVTNMGYMFNGCSGVTSIDVSNFNTSNVTNMELMFPNCSELTTIYAIPYNQETNKGWTTSAVTNSGQMFAGSTKLVGGNGTKYDSSHIDKEYARIDKPETPGYFSNKNPIWTKVSSTANAIDPNNKASSTSTITFRGTDDDFGASTLTIDDIQVLANGNLVTSGITKTLDSTTILRYRNGTQYGVEYTITIKGFAQNANQVKIKIPIGKLVDKSGNKSEETEFILYNVLRSAASENEATSAFLGNSNIQRQNVEKVEFVNSSPYGRGAIRSYDAINNTGNGHNNTNAWKDLSGNQDGILYGGTWGDDYLHLDGVDDWVNLGRVDFTDQVTFDATITVNEIENGERDILDNFDGAGAGIYLRIGIPTFDVYIKGERVSISTSKRIAVGEKTRITGIYDGANMYLYINGKLEAQKAQTGTIAKSSAVMAIGANPTGNQAQGYFNNINVYSAKVYDKAIPINTWDVSAQQDGSIMAWATQTEDQANRGVYTVNIGSNDEIFANQNSTQLFSYIGYAENCTAPDTIANIDLLNVTSVTNMYRMFRRCGQIAMTSLDLGNNFDTSNVTNMSALFEVTGELKMTTLNLGSKFDTSNVTNMRYMFNYCGLKSMSSLDLGDKFDTSKVTDMGRMFLQCGYTAMTSLNLGDKFDTRNVINMDDMFNSCGYTAMTILDLGDKFDTSKVTNMVNMFAHCGERAMTSLDLEDKFDTSNVINMEHMFDSCGEKSMTSLNLGNKFDTSKVTNMKYMFEQCGQDKLTSLNLGNNFDTSNVTDMSHMFYACGNKAMTSLNLGDKFDTSKVTNMRRMFQGCGNNAMTSLDLGDKFDTRNVTNMYRMFAGCGGTAMTSLDLGPLFTQIPTGDATDYEGSTVLANGNMLEGTGKSGCTIYVPEAIYKNEHELKLNSTDTTDTPDGLKYTRGTIIKK